MTKTLFDYLLMVEKEYKYRIKIAGEVTERQFDILEALLIKKDLKEVQSIVRTPIQSNPKDFPALSNVDVYIIDFTTTRPMSLQSMVEDIFAGTKIGPNLILVTGFSQLCDEESEEITSRNEREYYQRISDPYAKERETNVSDYVGDEYNKKMIDATLKAGEVNVKNPVFIEGSFKAALAKVFGE